MTLAESRQNKQRGGLKQVRTFVVGPFTDFRGRTIQDAVRHLGLLIHADARQVSIFWACSSPCLQQAAVTSMQDL